MWAEYSLVTCIASNHEILPAQLRWLPDLYLLGITPIELFKYRRHLITTDLQHAYALCLRYVAYERGENLCCERFFAGRYDRLTTRWRPHRIKTLGDRRNAEDQQAHDGDWADAIETQQRSECSFHAGSGLINRLEAAPRKLVAADPREARAAS